MKAFLFIISLTALTCKANPLFSSNPAYQKNGNDVLENKVYKESIKTVLLYRSGWELSMPIIELNSKDKLSLLFDEINKSHTSYSYTFIHCTSNWQPSDIAPLEYMEGYQTGTIDKYDFSQNTIVNYVNYQLEFPNDDIRFLVSGNYVVKVFEDNDPEKVVLTRRFYVYEPLAKVNAEIEKITIRQEEDKNQRVNFSVEYDGTEIENPYETLSYKIIKNNEIEKNYNNLKPTSIKGNTIEFNKNNELAFAGGNEYRHFDLKNFKYFSDRLQKIDKATDAYHILLKPDIDRDNKEYQLDEDLNGQKLIKLEKNDVSNIMADYCYVDFQLNVTIPLEQGNYYIYGAITDWNINDNYKMDFNPKTNLFEKHIFLKQGYYNYIYLFLSDDKFFHSESDRYRVEGNHFQTENDYQIFVYYKAYNKSYQRLVGFNSVNSIRK